MNTDSNLPATLNSKEGIFIFSNIDKDCGTIGRLLFDYGSRFIEPILEDGMYAFSVKYSLQREDSLTDHFMADEHWTFFDNFYSLAYAGLGIGA